MCTPTIGVHMASRRARQACRACTPVWRACKACTPFGQACRLCTPVGSRKPLDARGLREPRYPYKGTRTLIRARKGTSRTRTLIRVPKYPYKGTSRTLIRVPRLTRAGSARLSGTPARLLAMCTPIVGVHMACGMRGRACGSLHA
ncbi:hypothetical protein PCANC_11424 [Puccinia coronata f. sp. avenae]|uniref:Uncharacterized protein n=1 Tax=Puccinia coronata f. sp. avenae TaxID=200324 RepID=A0A2N5VMJ3_9BASI|nr:hypothetical protein PCANC_11424 [Puccinia coronata f. sp. avenae]